MALGINPITVAEAGPIVAEAMGFDWSADRAEVVKYINKYRLLVYTEYDKFKLFDDVFHTICVAKFKECNLGDCITEYQGFTLPEDVAGPEAVFSYGQSLKLRSRWREAHNGLGVDGLGRVEALMMAETFPTERDLQKTTKVKLFANSADDTGKVVNMEATDASGRLKKICFDLIGDSFVVSPVKLSKIHSISLPGNRKGSVRLMQDDGYELSEYTPWETVPSYRRMKLRSICPTGVVLLHGNRRYRDVFFDHDIVELGNRLIIEAASRYFKFGEATTEAKEINRAQLDRNEMERLILSEMSRFRGRAIQDENPYRGAAPVPRKSLPGYAR